MLTANTQQEAFVDEVLSDLFHHQTDRFLQLLERDGTRLLRFYWEEAGKKFPPEQRGDPFGLNYVTRRPAPFVTVHLITLPEPRAHGEAHFAALVYRPQRRLLLVSDVTSYYTLETVHPEEKTGQTEKTALVEWSRKLQRYKLREGIEPNLDAFYRAVLAELGEDPLME